MLARAIRLRGRLPDEAIVVPVLLGLSAVAWVLTHRMAGGDMRLGILTSPSDEPMAGMAGMAGGGGMDGRASMSMAFGLFMATWVVMMVAMMFPAVAPVVLIFRRWAHSRGRSPLATIAFVVGYLAIWSAVGLAAFATLQALHRWGPEQSTGALRVGAALLAAVGVYQLTPLKSTCIRHCRSPLSVVMHHGQLLSQGYVGPWRVGVVHGAYCIGCCWSLMLVLLLLGMMNLAWMGVVAAVVFAEKVFPAGELLSRAFGIGLIAAGLMLAAWPRSLPAIV